ncbi:MAG: 3-oxoacyl-ACP reductase FabG [Gemmataceae bacterium]
MTTFDFANKVCLVTGSSRGIGAAILSAFVRAGAQGILHYWDDPAGANRKDAEQLAATLGKNCTPVPADIRDSGQVQTMMSAVKGSFGGLDILVNNAGILKDRTIRKMSEEDWTSVINTNLTGVFHGCKFGGEILRDGGRIVNIASVAGLVGFPGQANYAAAKAGVIGMTRSLSKEFARRGITVNAIAPGIVETSMMADIKEEMRAEYIKQIPMGRFAKPADIAHAVLFLAAEESSYITGQILPVTGGWI